MDAATIEVVLTALRETPALLWPLGAAGFGWAVWKITPARSRDPVKQMHNGFDSIQSSLDRMEKQFDRIAAEQEAARAERAALANRATAIETTLRFLMPKDIQ